jgi:hypothetical protein
LTSLFITLTLVITGFLLLLNVLFAALYRRRQRIEVFSYLGAGLIEIAIFIFALLLRVGVLRHIPYHLPPGLPINRAEIGAALAIGIGMFPAAYWHRTSFSQMRERMAQDAKTLKEREAAVRIRSSAPGEWMN